MTDIVERLRFPYTAEPNTGRGVIVNLDGVREIMDEAADEIERLRQLVAFGNLRATEIYAEIERLRKIAIDRRLVADRIECELTARDAEIECLLADITQKAKMYWEQVTEIERLREATILQAGTISALTEEIGLLRVEIKRLEALTKETTHG